MPKQRTQFIAKAMIGMAATTVLAVTVSTPARAETIDLVCKFESWEKHVYVDTDRQTVSVTSVDKPYGPFAASISGTFIRWNGREYNGWDYQSTIDRTTGTITRKATHVDEVPGPWKAPTQYSNDTGQCRRATQKF